MAFRENQQVRIKKLKKPGLVTQVLKNGAYRIAIGDVLVTCKEHELETLEKINHKTHSGTLTSQVTLPSGETSKKSTLQRIDLHGMRVAEALSAVENHVNQAILADLDRFEVIHGLGSGKIREALHVFLSDLKVVKSFKIDGVNPGVTWVCL